MERKMSSISGVAMAVIAAGAAAGGIPDRPRVNTRTYFEDNARDMARVAAAEEKRKRKAAKRK